MWALLNGQTSPSLRSLWRSRSSYVDYSARRSYSSWTRLAFAAPRVKLRPDSSALEPDEPPLTLFGAMPRSLALCALAQPVISIALPFVSGT